MGQRAFLERHKADDGAFGAREDAIGELNRVCLVRGNLRARVEVRTVLALLGLLGL